MSEPAIIFDVRKIMEHLPHRYPFLLVDRVLEVDPGKSILAYKNVTMNEPFFQGHFPGLPVMPGVLIMEALAQAGGIMTLCAYSEEERAGKIFLFSSMDKVRFRKPVVPGDRLVLRCATLRQKLRLFKMNAAAFVDDVKVAEGELTAAMSFVGEM
jgi:3-hydroxyacyl-[acyl-carrier-protein] dehydratase